MRLHKGQNCPISGTTAFDLVPCLRKKEGHFRDLLNFQLKFMVNCVVSSAGLLGHRRNHLYQHRRDPREAWLR
jgi:hypothetical protein